MTTFNDTYDKTTPAGTDAPSVLDDRDRETKRAVQERENVDHYWPYASAADVAGGNEVASIYTGEHRKVTLYGNITDPTQVTGKGHLYMKGGDLFYQDATNTTLQITASGQLVSSAGLVVALNAAIGGNLDVTGNIDPTAYQTDNGGFLDEDDMASNAANKVASQQSIKAYADAAPAAQMTPASYAGEESVTFPNGLIMKMGVGASVGANSSKTITFGTAFPTAIKSIVVTKNGAIYTVAAGAQSISASSTSAFTYANGVAQAGTFNWIAIGY